MKDALSRLEAIDKYHIQDRHCEERSDEAIQTVAAVAFWIASLRSQ
jgi:hypothetical protein